METRDFCYWLQGYFEVAKPTKLNEQATLEIKQHLDAVFKKFPREPEKPKCIDPHFARPLIETQPHRDMFAAKFNESFGSC